MLSPHAAPVAAVLADVGIPILVVQGPAMVAALVPVIVLEALLARHMLALTTGRALAGAAVANVVSTLVGVPLAWALMLGLQVSATAAGLTPATGLPAVLAPVLHGAVPGGSTGGPPWLGPASMAVLGILSFFASVLIEWPIYLRFWKACARPAVSRATWVLNAASYGLLAASAVALVVVVLLTGG